MKSFFQSLFILALTLVSGSWQPHSNVAAYAPVADANHWEDSTMSPSALPKKNAEFQFKRFLEESLDQKFSTGTLEWLDLPFSENNYQSSYLGVLNGFHLFNLKAERAKISNVMVMESNGLIRDRKIVKWENQGVAIHLLNQQVLQIQYYNQENGLTGIDKLNYLLDQNGQFKNLHPVENVHPNRFFPEISTTIISIKELEELPEDILKDMVHEVYASNGEIFVDPELQKKFEATEWYVPGPADQPAQLAPIEEYNVSNIMWLVKALKI